jgi:hypothetical protein
MALSEHAGALHARDQRAAAGARHASGWPPCGCARRCRQWSSTRGRDSGIWRRWARVCFAASASGRGVRLMVVPCRITVRSSFPRDAHSNLDRHPAPTSLAPAPASSSASSETRVREERPHTYRHTSRDDLARLAPATLSRHNPTPGHTKTKRSEPLSIQLEVGPPARPALRSPLQVSRAPRRDGRAAGRGLALNTYTHTHARARRGIDTREARETSVSRAVIPRGSGASRVPCLPRR